MGTPLLEVLRTVATDADARSAFEADPSGYLGQYGYGDVPLDDLAEAVELTADTLPPETAMEIAPSAEDPGLVGVLREHETGDGPSEDAPSGELAFGDADFEGEPDAADPDIDAVEVGDAGAPEAGADGAFAPATGTDEVVDEVDFGSGSLVDEPGLEDPTGEPAYDGHGLGDEPGLGHDTGWGGDAEAGLPGDPVEAEPPMGADDPSFDEAEGFAAQLDDGPTNSVEPDIDDIGSF